MSFLEIFSKIDPDRLKNDIDSATPDDVRRTLAKEQPDESDIRVLFSAAAGEFLEEIVRRSAFVTERRFGKVVNLYAPHYVSNECVNSCVYCAFNRQTGTVRKTLTMDEVERDAAILFEEGFRHILIVSGESPRHVPVAYLEEVARLLARSFASVSIEVYPMDTGDYARLEKAGVDGLTVYQETYDRALYARVHPAGPKRNFEYRLAAPERGGAAGFRSLGIGVLLGLGDWRFDAAMLSAHGLYLGKKFWQSRVAVSFPRITNTPGGYAPDARVSDAELVQMLAGVRLLMPNAELVVSTREPAALRDNLVGLGVTRMSAGSRTSPGGYSGEDAGKEQFAVTDRRDAGAVAAMILSKGFEPVWKDFDREFMTDERKRTHFIDTPSPRG